MVNNLFIKMTYLPDSLLDEDRTTYSNKHKQVENKDVHILFLVFLGAFKCVQAFECIVLVFAFIIMIVTSLYVASERFREVSVAVFVVIACFATGKLLLIEIKLIMCTWTLSSSPCCNFQYE